MARPSKLMTHQVKRGSVLGIYWQYASGISRRANTEQLAFCIVSVYRRFNKHPNTNTIDIFTPPYPLNPGGLKHPNTPTLKRLFFRPLRVIFCTQICTFNKIFKREKITVLFYHILSINLIIKVT